MCTRANCLLLPHPQVFAKDAFVPPVPLEPFDFTTNDAIGKLVVIPASKYLTFAIKESKEVSGRGDFLGWAGKVMAFEDSRRKLKIKIHEDKGLEHLSITSGKYAVANLQRLL